MDRSINVSDIVGGNKERTREGNYKAVMSINENNNKIN